VWRVALTDIMQAAATQETGWPLPTGQRRSPSRSTSDR
jgi:hypothetical protein